MHVNLKKNNNNYLKINREFTMITSCKL